MKCNPFSLCGLVFWILLCGLAFAREQATMSIEITQPYLQFPVKQGETKRWIDFYVDGQLIRRGEVELTAEEPQYWVDLDVSNLIGKTLTLVPGQDFADHHELLAGIRQSAQFSRPQEVYKEPLRPQIHYTPRQGWVSDANGLVWHEGEFHLFYQHNPLGAWRNRTVGWGHAVSRDLVHWTELPTAIDADERGAIWSGSSVVDTRNTCGLGTGGHAPIVSFYTLASWDEAARPFAQEMAWSTDRGRTFTKYPGNPVVAHIEGQNRDPKVFWHEASGRWVMLLFVGEKQMQILNSTDLIHWEPCSRVEVDNECPELFPMPMDGDPEQVRWIIHGGIGDYKVGTFDGKTFTAQTGLIRFHYGSAFYASQTFNNVPASDGRRIQIGWGGVTVEGQPFNQLMTFPTELTLKSTPEGPRLFVNPVREIALLHQAPRSWQDATLDAQNDPVGLLPEGPLDIQAQLDVSQTQRLVLSVRGLELVYDAMAGQMHFGHLVAPLPAEGGKINLRILIDTTTIDLYGNDGALYMPMVALPASQVFTTPEIRWSAQGTVQIDSMTAWPLKSMWE